MKWYFFFFFNLQLIGLCAQDYRAAIVRTNDQGQITLDIWNVRRGKKYDLEEARKEAVMSILFYSQESDGRNSSYIPLLNNNEAKISFANIQKKFFARNGEYSRFILSTDFNESTAPRIAIENEWKIYRICISKNELRKYLEDNGVIIKLNNHF